MIKLTLIFQIFIFLFLFDSIIAQESVQFTYDDSGNRVSRTILWEDKDTEPETNFDTTLYKQDDLTEDDIVKQSITLGEQKINIYPNPTKGTFKVGLEGWDKELDALIQLFSVNGNLIFEKRVDKSITSLDIVNQPNGTYILAVIIEEKKETWKIVKR